jgi:hypothetical protein
MKKEPIKISEMDVQPISDEDLRGLRGGSIASTSSIFCTEYSDVVEERPCCNT